jgi:hypothetical protein
MGTQVIVQRVSDISGKSVEDESQLTRLVIEHPDFKDPVTLEVLPEEVEDELPQEQEAVLVTYFFPGESVGQKYALTQQQLDTIFQGQPITEVLERVYREQQEERHRQEQESRTRGRGRGRRGGKQAVIQERPRIDYTSAEHAGEPHRGITSDAEKEYVRDNLDEVNERLREKGMRQIDPDDPEMAQRYGLAPPVVP